MMLQLQTPSSPPPPPPKPRITQTTLKTLLSTTTTTTTTTDSGVKFRQKLLYLRHLNVNPAKVLHINPDIRSAPLSTLHSITQCLNSMGLEFAAVGRILDMYPQLLTADPYDDVYPILDFLLHTVKLPFSEIRKSINRCPRILVCNPESQLKPAFDFLSEFGFVGPNKLTSQTTLLLVSNVESTLMPKIEFLLGLGIEYDEVRNMVLRSPSLLTLSVENNFRPKVEYFFDEMNRDLEEIKRFPQYFSFSLERKIKPRHRLLTEHGFFMPLSEMLKVSDGDFNLRLIEKRLQIVGELL